MAVPEQTPYKEYEGNGVVKSFPLTFDCDNQEHLIVLVDGVEPIVGTWSLNTGTVVFSIAPLNDSKITFQRNTPLKRDTNFQSYDNSFRPPVVNKDFDGIWRKLQELGVTNWLTDTDIKNLGAYVNSLNDETRDDFFNKLGSLEQNTNAMLEEAIKNGAVSSLAITTVNSFNELNTIAKWEGRTVFVKGLQGGSFEYKASKAYQNDGGTVFNGWVRITLLTENLVEWWGAKWDGTDTTEALDKAIIESAKQKRTLFFGGAERTYIVNTMRHVAGWQACAFLISEDNINLRGDGCKIIADNRFTEMPEEGHLWYYRFFCQTVGSIKENFNVYGIDFDTQFDKYEDDKHKIGGLITSNVILDNVYFEKCNFYNSSGTNSIGCFNDYLASASLSKNWKILGCRFINSGYGGDHSAIYLMCDDAEVKVDVLQQFDDPAKNMWCSNAIEIHGDNQNVHDCFIDKVAGGIIAGINYRSPVKGTKISSNTINTYSGGITTWSGEDIHDKGHDDVTMQNNTVRVLPFLKNGRRLGIGSGGFGNSIGTLVCTGNDVICEDVEDAESLATPIDFTFTTGGTGFAQIGGLNISNNPVRGANGIIVKSDMMNFTYRDIIVKDNPIFIDHGKQDITNRGVTIDLPPPSSVLNNRSVVLDGNHVTSNSPQFVIGYWLSGFINKLTLNNKIQGGLQKYYLANEPTAYVDCETIHEPTNISTTVKLQNKNEMRFSVDLAALRTSINSTLLLLCTLPARTVLKSVNSINIINATNVVNPVINVGNQTTQRAFLKDIPILSVSLGGFSDADKGSLLSGVIGAYFSNPENIVLNLTADNSLQNMSGIIEIVIKFDYV